MLGWLSSSLVRVHTADPTESLRNPLPCSTPAHSCPCPQLRSALPSPPQGEASVKREAYEIRRTWLQKRQTELKQALGLGHLEVGFHAASQSLQEANLEGAPTRARETGSLSHVCKPC